MAEQTNGEQGFDSPQDELLAAVALHPTAGVITKLEQMGAHWRRYATETLKKLDSKTYAKYRAIKYADGATKNPDMATRQEAYLFAAMAALEAFFDHPLCAPWRHTAAAVVEVLDPATHLAYSQVKHGAGVPDKATKIAAYRIVFKRFLELAYTVPNL